jgi:hypothetical protein
LKKLLLTVIVVASIKTATAQAWWGIKAGFNISNIILTDPYQKYGKFTPITDFSGGMLVAIRLRDHLFLQPELMISGQGGTLNGVTEHFVYFNTPILIRYQSPNGWFAETGMQPGIIIDENHTLVDNANHNQKSQTDVSWVFGAGYQTKINLGIDIRYNIGVVPFYVVNGQGINGRNSVLQFSIFYIFPKRKSDFLNYFPTKKKTT